jgi:hypothetical protein
MVKLPDNILLLDLRTVTLLDSDFVVFFLIVNDEEAP